MKGWHAPKPQTRMYSWRNDTAAHPVHTGSPQAAMFMAAIILHGVKPGPMLSIEQPEFLYTTGVTLFVAACFMLVIGLLLTRPMVHVLKLNRKILMPIVVPMTVIGAFATNVNIFDIKVMFIFGVLGFILRKFEFPMAPLVLGLILGNMADKAFRQALMQGQGSVIPLLGRPVGLILIAAIILSLYSGFRRYGKDKSQAGRGGLDCALSGNLNDYEVKPMNVKDKVILVTGGAGGLGSAIAKCLAENGAEVYLLDMDEQRGIGIARDIVNMGTARILKSRPDM